MGVVAACACLGIWLSVATIGCCDSPVRTPKVAGKFYPADRSQLLKTVSGLLDRGLGTAVTQRPRILIVPHAGYSYSGPVAAAAFRQLKGYAYDGVVVVGFTHRAQFDGASVDEAAAYETPLGQLPVDQEAVARLRKFPGVRHLEEAHESDEHSLEVELPFVQAVLGSPKLIPILMGNARLDDAKQLATALAALANTGDYLFVFSTDLSHYHPSDEAKTIDQRAVNAILFETPQAVSRLFLRGQLEACGRGPILTGLLLAQQLGDLEPELILYANSGETAGDPSSVVGYAAIAMVERPAPPTKRLSEEAGQALVSAARQSLEHFLAKREPQPTVLLDQYPELAQAHGVFVTLRKRGELRGCIGRIETETPLTQLVPVVALDAALRDERFEPVTAEELEDLHVEVSVLTPPATISNPKEIVAGRDGIVLEHQGRRGVFLPQVWADTGWTRVEFLRELASQKAGLPPDAWQQATLYTFQDQAFEEAR